MLAHIAVKYLSTCIFCAMASRPGFANFTLRHTITLLKYASEATVGKELDNDLIKKTSVNSWRNEISASVCEKNG